MPDFDVIIVGGSFAGLTAAMQLGRARRKVTVLDTGLNRNRYAAHAHNILGHDGTPPSDLLASARAQVAQAGTAASHEQNKKNRLERRAGGVPRFRTAA